MKCWNWAGIMLLIVPVTPALAVNKCVENSGRIFYQAAPCPANTHGGELSRNINRTFSGQVQRSATTGVITVIPDNTLPVQNQASPDGQ
ncbi:MAG TPA: hypothetical protein DEP36_05625 [Gammaproteobacteria bacterium]|nr:hypothetical protein [Gammaproteobacteria bacterium]HRF44806.1 hypothetical protein [Candidatus Competibacteraceae bacterium]